MGKEILTFGDLEIENINFMAIRCRYWCRYKDVDIQKILVSNKISFREKNYKYFIGC